MCCCQPHKACCADAARARLQKLVAGVTLLCWACRWGTQQLEAGLGGSRPLQKDLAVAVANAHCDAAEKVGRTAPARCPGLPAAVSEAIITQPLSLKSGLFLVQTYASDDIATYESMDAALQLLRQHRLAPKLQADISTALEVGRLPLRLVIQVPARWTCSQVDVQSQSTRLLPAKCISGM